MYLANKYNATLTSGYTVGQTVLNVSAVPENVPTLIVAAKDTDKETVFAVTDKTVNTLTGVTRLRGANVNLDSSTPLTCLNLVEFINQLGSTAKASGADIDTGTEDAKIVTPKAIADSYLAGLWDGWIPDPDTWVYVSATSFKIEGKDVTARFPKGTKIKLTQTSAKYFYVTAAAFSIDTTITITAGSDYTLANEAITSPYYSYATAPQGFPAYFAYTPTITFAGGTTDPTTVTPAGRFCINGGAVSVTMVISMTRGSGNRLYTSFTLPTKYSSIGNGSVSSFWTSTTTVTHGSYGGGSERLTIYHGTMTADGSLYANLTYFL
jgi:hypothetical protein